LITYHCGKCGRSVTHGRGYIHIDLQQIDSRTIARRAWEAKHPGLFTGSDLNEYPPAVLWEIHHRDCDPEPARYDYWIDTERADTHETLLSWTAHLLDKDWIIETDWAAFIYRHISPEAAAV
jgi:hypothetical protein